MLGDLGELWVLRTLAIKTSFTHSLSRGEANLESATIDFAIGPDVSGSLAMTRAIVATIQGIGTMTRGSVSRIEAIVTMTRAIVAMTRAIVAMT